MTVNEAVILAGGLGTRIQEKTSIKPKPMVTIGKNPILMEIISHFVKYGCNSIVICGGYKVDYIRNYFIKSEITTCHEVSENLDTFSILINETIVKVKLIDTGMNTPTGGRLKMIQKELTCQSFFCTYGDGLSNVNLYNLVELHLINQDIATLTAVRPPSRFGVLEIDNSGKVTEFLEKPRNSWVNGGFFVFNQKIFEFLKDDSSLEVDVLPSIAQKQKLSAHKHDGFWYSMDTLRDFEFLNQLAKETPPPWK
jgi:glucose-1-phosphate cytidylyltransferase